MADLGMVGAGISGGLQGLVEAYKMKMEQAQEAAKTRQSGFNAARQEKDETLGWARLAATIQANKDREKARGASGLSEDDKAAWVRELEAGTPLSEIGVRGLPRAQVGAEYIRKRESEGGESLPTIGGLAVGQKAKTMSASALNQASIRKTLAAFPQYTKALDQYLVEAEKLKPGGLIPLNRIVQAGAEHIGATKGYGNALSTAKALQTELAMQGSRVFADTAMQEQAFKNELSRLNTTLPITRIREIVKTMKDLAESRRAELTGMGVNMPTGVNVGIPGGPQGEVIEDGYRFKGGDKADPTNWEPVE